MNELFNHLSSISGERDQKLKSLLTDQTAREVSLFRESLIPHRFGPEQAGRIEEALQFNLGLNYGPRDLDRYYAAHPVRVARFMARWLAPGAQRAADAVVASLVHNVLEKNLAPAEDLRSRYGDWVCAGLLALVCDRAAMAEEKGRVAYYAALSRQPVEIQALKFFDKFDNLFALCLNPDDAVRSQYLVEIERHVRLLAERAAPELVSYLDELIADSRKLGCVRP